MQSTKYSFCRNCPASCGMTFQVEDNRITSHKADAENPLSRGFKCIKGDMSVDLLNGVEPRLTTCRKRLPDGRFVDILPSEIIEETAEKLKSLIDQHGPRCAAMFRGTGSYTNSLTLPLARMFMAAINSPNVFSTMTIDQSAHWVVDGRMGMFTTGRPFFQDVDVLCVVGTNPVVSHGTYFIAFPPNNQAKNFKDLKARGGKLIVVDPRKTETAGYADLHIQPRPGFDAEIFAALIRIVLENSWQDKGFCDRYTAHVEELRAAVDPFTPEMVSERAGVPADQLMTAARLISQARKPSVGFGTGTAMSRNPNVAAHMVEALNALCGGFLRAGDEVRHPGIFMKRPLVERVAPPVRTWEFDPKLSSGHGQLKGEFPSSRLADEILQDGPNKIRALFVLAANPIMAFGEPHRLREALKDLELLVVIDPRMTETAELADYVVAPPLQYETTDTTMFSDAMQHEAFVQYVSPVVSPPPGTLPEWAYFNGVANRLGKVMTAQPMLYGVDPKTASGGLHLTPDVAWTGAMLIDWFCEQAGLDVEELKRQPHGIKPDLPASTISAPESDDQNRLDLCPPDVADELGALLDEQPDSERQYLLINRRIVETFNSMFRHSPITKRRHKTNGLYIHPDDLKSDGIAEGDAVVITGTHGRIIGYAKSDKSMRRGVVSMTHCWGALDEEDDPEGLRGAHLGKLVSMRLEDVQQIDGMPLQSGIPVHIMRQSDLTIRGENA